MSPKRPHSNQDGPTSNGRDYRESPSVFTWEVTQACELACGHCRVDASRGRHPDELTTEEGKNLIDRVTEFDSPKPLFVFSGGNPLKRPDLFELVEYAADSGLKTAVTPAPTPTLTASDLDRFKNIGTNRIALPLDGATAEQHDSFRGEDGSFEAMCRAAEYANEIGLSVQIYTTVTTTTEDHLADIATLVETYDVVTWKLFLHIPIGRGENLEELSSMRTEQTLEWLYRYQRTAPFRVAIVEAPQYLRIGRCVEQMESRGNTELGSPSVGNRSMFVSHTGSIYPSGFLHVEVGNVRRYNVVERYRDAILFEMLRDPDNLLGVCAECPHRTLCGGSRARAHATTGYPFGSDPLCTWVENSEK